MPVIKKNKTTPLLGTLIPRKNVDGDWTKKLYQELTGAANPNFAKTHGCILKAPCPDFTHVRLVFANQEATPPTITGVSVAATNTNTDIVTPSTGSGLTNDGATGWVRGTFNGSNTVAMPAAGPDVNTPATIATDWIPLNSITPINGVSTPYLLCRVQISAAFSYVALTSDDTINLNSKSSYIECYRGGSDGDYVTTPTTMTNGNKAASPNTPFYAFEFRSSKQVIRIACVGDSITAGKHATLTQGGASKTYLGWWQQAQEIAITQGLPISMFQSAVGGTLTSQYLAFGKNNLALHTPSVAVYSIFSPNDGPTGASNGGLTQALMNTQFQRAMDFAAYCRSLNILPVFTVLAPNDNYSSTDDNFLKGLIARIKATSFPVIDLSTTVSTNATPRRFIAGLNDDTIHPNAAGYAAMADLFLQKIKELIRKNYNI